MICRTPLVKSKNRVTDFQRLRRNVPREIHDHSAPHRTLLCYENLEVRAEDRSNLHPGLRFHLPATCRFIPGPLDVADNRGTIRKRDGATEDRGRQAGGLLV